MPSTTAVGKATGYGLEGLREGVRVPVGQYLPPLHVIQTDYGALLASHPVGTRGFVPGIKRHEREAEIHHNSCLGQEYLDL
jgi:hypothetical protein